MSTSNIRRYIDEIVKALEQGQNLREVANDYGVDSQYLQDYIEYHFGAKVFINKGVSREQRERTHDIAKKRAAEAQQALKAERIKAKREAAQKEVSQNPYLRAITGKTGSFKTKNSR